MPQKILLFIPGYYGSRLKEKETGILRWAHAPNFIFSQTGVSDEIPGTTIGRSKELVTDGILTNVKMLPYIWDVDSYGKTIAQLKKFALENQMTLETLTYDWRQDFNECLITVDEKLKGLDLKPGDELFVVAHSLGALLMSYYIRYGAQDVESAIESWEGLKHITKMALIAPPLHGLMILFRDIEEGTAQGLNRSLLSSRDYSTFKSSYFFIPPKGEDLVSDEKGEKVSLGIHDIKLWEKNSWGPFKFASFSERSHVKDFVAKYMLRSEKFHALLRAPVKVTPPKKIPLLHLRGIGKKTKEIASLKIRKDRMIYRFGREGEIDGDGTVTTESGRPLEFFKQMDLITADMKSEHLAILSDENSQAFIQNFLKKN